MFGKVVWMNSLKQTRCIICMTRNISLQYRFCVFGKVVWMNGGPGASSMFGMMTGIVNILFSVCVIQVTYLIQRVCFGEFSFRSHHGDGIAQSLVLSPSIMIA